MAAERVVGSDGSGDQVGTLRLDARIDVLAPVTIGPPVEAAILDGGQIVWRHVIAEFIALVHYGPQRAGRGLEGHAIGVAQARGENPRAPAGEVELEDGGSTLLDVHTVLADIAA